MSSALALAMVGSAHADTIVTFADPATTGATPVFALTGNQLTGGWSGTGLTLLTPGLAAPNYLNATFQMTPVTVTLIVPGLFSTSAGSLSFFDGANPLLTISFQAGFLNSPFSFGASDFIGQGVAFSGPVVTSPFLDESFAFSFANYTPTAGGFTVTSAFTSSANPEIPAPAGFAGFAIGALVLARRRRS